MRFATVVADECGGKRAFVWLQDYPLALCPTLFRQRLPDLAITVRRAPGGQIVYWKATAQEIELRDRRGAALQRRRAQKTSEKGMSSNRGAKRTSASTQTTLA